MWGEALLSACAAASIAAILVWLGPPGSDLAAHAYQRTLFLEHGFTLWNNFWYAGRYSFVTYSVIYYPLAALLGIKLLAVATIALAALAFALVIWHEWGATTRWSSRTFAVVWAGIVLSAAFPFALGMALALLALWALQTRARWQFAALATLTLAASPVAFLLLVVVLAGVALARRASVPRNWLAVAAIGFAGVVELVLWRLFPGGGDYPYSFAELAAGVVFCGLGLIFTWNVERARVLRFVFAVYLVSIVVIYVVPSAVGENVARMRYAAIPLAVLILSLRHWRPLVPGIAVIALAVSWNLSPLAFNYVHGQKDATAAASTWPSAIRYLQAYAEPEFRVESVDTTGPLGRGLPRGREHPARARLVPAGRLPREQDPVQQARPARVPRVAAQPRRRLRRAAAEGAARLQLARGGRAHPQRPLRPHPRLPHGDARDLPRARRAADRHRARRARAPVDDGVEDRRVRDARRHLPHRGAVVAVLAHVGRLPQQGQGRDAAAHDAARAARHDQLHRQRRQRARHARRHEAELHAAGYVRSTAFAVASARRRSAVTSGASRASARTT